MPGPRITREQLTAIETLYAAGVPQAEIAARVKVNKNTVFRHVHDPNFRVDHRDIRERVKAQNATEALKHTAKLHGLIDHTLTRKKPFELKAATGALKDLDQISAVAAGDDKQAGVASAPPAHADLKVLIQQILGTAPVSPALDP